MTARMGDRVIAGILIVLAVAMFVATLNFPPPGQPNDPGTGAFPRIVAVGLGLMALGLLLRPDPLAFVPPRDRLGRVVGIMVWTAAYAFMLQPLGFVAATIVFLVGALLIMQVRRLLTLVLVPLGVALALHYVFSVALAVYLPPGFIEGILP
jgi:putative tricarboxylic transport membrane protein